ncbi:hypothetical protein FRC09_006643, partial [Ceratobasidium sp. 395]
IGLGVTMVIQCVRQIPTGIKIFMTDLPAFMSAAICKAVPDIPICPKVNRKDEDEAGVEAGGGREGARTRLEQSKKETEPENATENVVVSSAHSAGKVLSQSRTFEQDTHRGERSESAGTFAGGKRSENGT